MPKKMLMNTQKEQKMSKVFREWFDTVDKNSQEWLDFVKKQQQDEDMVAELLEGMDNGDQ